MTQPSSFFTLCLVILCSGICFQIYGRFYFLDDCDETFNYLEPLYQLFSAWTGDGCSSSQTGHNEGVSYAFTKERPGFQPWEYAGQFHMRSYIPLWITWEYLHAFTTWLPDALLGYFGLIGEPQDLNKNNGFSIFFLLRAVLAAVSTLALSYLLYTLKKHADRGYPSKDDQNIRMTLSTSNRLSLRGAIFPHPCIWITFAILFVLSPIAYPSTVTFLPNTASMVFSMIALACFFNGSKMTWITIQALSLFFGWPYHVIVTSVVPGLYMFLWAKPRGTLLQFGVHIGYATILLAMLSMIFIIIDGSSWFYNQSTWAVPAPLQAIIYNVSFLRQLLNADPSSLNYHGPELYGTEPFWWYLRNLVLLKHISLPFLLLSPIILLVSPGLIPSSKIRCLIINVVFSLGVFSLQPHKEARFLYGLYPEIVLVTAISVHVFFQSILSKIITDKSLRRKWLGVFFIAFITISLWRMYTLNEYYRGPISLMEDLHVKASQGRILDTSHIKSPEINICMGSGWYRFPSHFLLPSNIHGKNVKLGFFNSSTTCMLPQYFSTKPNALSRTVSTLNNYNKADPAQFISESSCHYILDTATALPSKSWEPVMCSRLLDHGSTSLIHRLFYISDRFSSFTDFCIWKPL
jgi:alpha-1,2-mannosyltransferase